MPTPQRERGRSHGKLSSWTLVAAVLAASVTAGAALIFHVWWLFWVAVAVVRASTPAVVQARDQVPQARVAH